MSHDGIAVRVYFEVDGIRGSERVRVFGLGEEHPMGEVLWMFDSKLRRLKSAGEILAFRLLSAEILGA